MGSAPVGLSVVARVVRAPLYVQRQLHQVGRTRMQTGVRRPAGWLFVSRSKGVHMIERCPPCRLACCSLCRALQGHRRLYFL